MAFGPPNNPYAIDHEVPLLGLQPDQVYFVQARAEDRSGFVYRSEVLSFTTTSAMPSSTDGALNVATLRAGAQVLTVSSNFGPTDDLNSTWGLHKALDEDARSDWSTHFDGDAAAFELDLGQIRQIERVAFRSREMADSTSIIQAFELLIEDRAFGPFSTPDPSQRYEFSVTAEGRRVRFNAVRTTGGNTGARSFELFGR